MRQKSDPCTQRDVLADNAIGPNDNPLREGRFRGDDSRSVYLRHLRIVYSFRIIAAKTASAIRLSPTLAWPSNFQTFPRFRCLATWTSSLSPGKTGRRKRALSTLMK